MAALPSEVSGNERPAERQFWLDMAAGGLLSHFYLTQFLEICRRWSPEESDDLQNDLNNLLTQLDYAADTDGIADAHGPARAEEPGYWLGSYALFDEEGNRYALRVSQDEVSIDTGAEILDEFTLSESRLRIANERYAFELVFAPAVDRAAQRDTGAAAALTRTHPSCVGTVRITEGRATRTLKVAGRRGCYSEAGIAHAADGDPVGFWTGNYALTHTGEDWKMPDGWLRMREQDGILAVTLQSPQWGSVPATQVKFADNMLQCEFAKGIGNGPARFAGQFRMTLDGAKAFRGVLESGSSGTPLAGFLTASTDAPRRLVKATGVLSARRAARGLLAAAGAEPIAIDVGALDEATLVELPDGVAGQPYSVALKLVKGAAALSGSFSWAVEGDTEKRFSVTPDSVDSAKAVLTGTPKRSAAYFTLAITGVFAGTASTTKRFKFVAQLAEDGSVALDAHGSAAAAIQLPDAIAGIPVQLTLRLESGPTTGSFAWTVLTNEHTVGGKASTSSPFTLTANSQQSTEATITGSADVSVLSLKVRLSGVGNSFQKTFELKMSVIDGGDIRTIDIDLDQYHGDHAFTLPIGVERNRYTLALRPMRGGAVDRAVYQWSLEEPDEHYTNIFKITPLPSNKAIGVLHGTFGETEHAGHANIALKLKSATETRTLRLKIPVESRLPITLNFVELPLVARGKPYSFKLVANGGDEPYTWSQDPATPLPKGLSFDPATGLVSGTHDGLDHSQATYGVAFTINGKGDVVMNPARVTLFFKIDEPQQIGTEVTSWFGFILQFGGVVGGLWLVGNLIHDWKENKDKANAARANDIVRTRNAAAKAIEDRYNQKAAEFARALDTAIKADLKAPVKLAKDQLKRVEDMLKDQRAETQRREKALETKITSETARLNTAALGPGEKVKLEQEIRELEVERRMEQEKLSEIARRTDENKHDLAAKDPEMRRRARLYGL